VGFLAVLAANCVAVGAPEETVSEAGVAEESHRDDEHERANGAWLSFQEEARQVEDHEHDVVVKKRWIDRLRKKQHRNQPLQAIHLPRTPTRSASLCLISG
jgi:hypothetical protein